MRGSGQMIRLMVSEHINMLMELYMKVIGRMISNMVKVMSVGLMVRPTWVLTSTARSRV